MTKQILLLLVLLAFGATAYGQDDPPPAAAPVRRVGKAKVYFFPKRNESSGDLYLNLKGDTAGLYKEGKHIVALYLHYSVPGPKAVEPRSLTLTISEDSWGNSKYLHAHHLTLTADGKQVLDVDLQVDMIMSSHGTGGLYVSMKLNELSYADFHKIAMARSVTMKLGKTKIDFSPEMIQALKDLDNTIDR
jgi:hypothetical protein